MINNNNKNNNKNTYLLTDDLKWIAVIKIVNDQSVVIMVTIKVKGGDMNQLKHRF